MVTTSKTYPSSNLKQIFHNYLPTMMAHIWQLVKSTLQMNVRQYLTGKLTMAKHAEVTLIIQNHVF